MGQTLVDIPLNYHCDCLLSYPSQYYKILEDRFNQVESDITEQHEQEWNETT